MVLDAGTFTKRKHNFACQVIRAFNCDRYNELKRVTLDWISGDRTLNTKGELCPSFQHNRNTGGGDKQPKHRTSNSSKPPCPIKPAVVLNNARLVNSVHICKQHTAGLVKGCTRANHNMSLTQSMFFHSGVFLATICLPSASLFEVEAMIKIQIKKAGILQRNEPSASNSWTGTNDI